MRFRVLISFLIISLSIFIIYNLNIDNKVYYFNIMDKEYDYDTYNVLLNKNIKNKEKYINHVEYDYRTTDLIRNIKDNIGIDDKKIQNILIKADIITLMIGNNELIYKSNTSDMTELFEYSNSLIEDLDELFKLIRKYCKEKIFFIGFYNNNEYYNELYTFLNLRIKDLCSDYDIEYINRSDIFNEQENVNIYNKIYQKVLL